MWKQGEEKQEKSTGRQTYTAAQGLAAGTQGGWLAGGPGLAGQSWGDTQGSSLKTKGFAYVSSPYPHFLHGTWTPHPQSILHPAAGAIFKNID